MDPTRFDHLTRLLGRTGGRRTVLGALFGALLGPAAAEAAKKRHKARGNGKDREREQRSPPEHHKGGQRRQHNKHKKKRGGSGDNQDKRSTPECCGTKSCPDPRSGSTRAGCDYAGRSFAGQTLTGSIFRGIDGRGATFTAADARGVIFAEACLQGANFRRTKLSGATWGEACLFDADFTGADVGTEAAVFNDALFCNTIMPDGSVNDRDCDHDTPCCQRSAEPGPACQSASDCPDEACRAKACQGRQCVYTLVADGADPSGQCATHCCEGGCCNPGATECNPEGLCCAPNCAGRACGPDGCGGTGTCGSCQDNQVCDDDSGQCLCTRQSCPNGCCANGRGNPGVCRPGDTVQNCGTGGAACTACDPGDGCLNQQCTACSPACQPGLRCNANGQCVCDGQSCPSGCCFSNSGGSICLDGEVDAFCGSHGEACVDCGGGARCVGQVCVCLAGLCDGCCENGPNNPGRCLANTPPVCGVDGNQCTSCPAGDGKTCNAQGQCVCTPQSCPNGCCDEDGNCQPGNTRAACGTGGQACARCAAGQGCQNGVCACTQQSCPNGCCAADGTCQPGNAFGACGTGGAPCAGCNDQQTCQDQQCAACGSSCTCTGQSLCTDDGASNLQCNGPGDPNACFCYVSQTGQPICGGSVTILEPNGCRSDADCGAGACVASTGTGPCGANGKPFCVGPCCQPNCAGKQCGPDGCGGNCGTCDGALQCENGTCVSPCTPQTCPDGCCAADGTCQPGTATGVCGTGGAACQACGAGQGCIGRECQACVPRTCQDLGDVCGPQSDNCGGIVQCGACPLGGGTPSCQNGACRACADVCPDLCAVCIQLPDGSTECVGNAVTFCLEAPTCTTDADCGSQFPRCVTSTVDRATGDTSFLPDVCQKPGAVGICVAVTSCCQPDCTGKQCGDDGCGGSCGSCGPCQECQNGACQTTGQFCGGICCALTGEFCCTDAGPYCCSTSYVACCQGTCCS